MIEDTIAFFLAGERSFRRVEQEFGLKGTALRVLLSLRSLHIRQYNFISVAMLRANNACRNDRDIYNGLVMLTYHGLVDRTSLQRGPRVGDVYALNGNGLNVANRFEKLVAAELK